jgi:large subunit ribosomal protein L22
VSHVGQSPYKVRRVLDLVRGLPVEDAEAVLTHTHRGAAEPVLKCLRSAIANAEHNMALDRDELFIAEAYADEGPTIKRWRPRARGRSTRIRKRTSHITIVVGDEEESA